jgi:putative holliday junction resolvase
MTAAVVLAFDFGTRRIGVAIGNTVTREARPLAVIDAAADKRWAAVAALIEQWQPAQIVVGIPRHPDGAAHEMTERCERFARQLEGRYRRPSVVSGGADDAAAAVILQQWFDEAA